ncbi:MAG: hypothetical protein LBJ46_09920 [Planctomycetota bacterium]|jgi:hypothetical protein|nr:hypothetical protein [Planctomycetota bacterium]
MGKVVGRLPLGAVALTAIAAVAVARGGAADAVAFTSADALSVRKNANVAVGGELHADYGYRRPAKTGTKASWSLQRANLRIRADVHPAASVFFKFDLSDGSEPYREEDRIFEEALLVMHSVAGSGFDVFAGRGRAPYGQDVTLGMLQSYHHRAHREDSSEGRIFIVDPRGDEVPDPADPTNPAKRRRLPPMRPGQIDRAALAGAAYQWGDRWRVEAAVFQLGDDGRKARLERFGATDAGVGAAARVWWRPVEDLTLQASVTAAHSSGMGDGSLRLDLADGARARENAWAASVGFDWRSGPWRVFGEYQRGWNANFSTGYGVDIAQLGAQREIMPGKRLGGMVEWLRLEEKGLDKRGDAYWKAVMNFRWDFSTSVYMMFEYGWEAVRRKKPEGYPAKDRGTFFGVRIGMSY